MYSPTKTKGAVVEKSHLTIDDFKKPAIIFNNRTKKAIAWNKAASQLFSLKGKENFTTQDLGILIHDDDETVIVQKSSTKPLIVKVRQEEINYCGKPSILKFFIKVNSSVRKIDFEKVITKTSIISRADAKGNITYVNNNFIKISGFKKSELIGRNHRIINSSYHPKSFWVEMWKTISKGKIWRAEVRNKRKDGSYYWVDTFIMPQKDEKGKVIEYLSIRNDITIRKQFEEALERSEKKLSETLHFGRLGSAEVSLELNQIKIYKELLHLFGEESNTTKWMSLSVFVKKYIHHDSQHKFLESIHGPVKGTASFDIQYKAQGKKKGWFAVRVIEREETRLLICHDITRIKDAQEEALSQSNKLKNVLHGITDGFFVIDRHFNFQLVNPHFAQQIGKTVEALEGANFLQLVPWFKKTELYKIYCKALKTKNSISLEYSVATLGQQVYEINIYPSEDGLFVYYKNITLAHKLKEEHKESLKLFQRLSENVPGMIYNYYTDQQGEPHFPFVSIGSIQLCGLSPEEIQSNPRNFFELIHRDDLPGVLQSIDLAYKNNRQWISEFRILLRDKSVRWISAASAPYQEKNGEHYWYGFMHDVTERKLADEHIAASELKNRLIIENSGEGILFIHNNGKIISANHELCRMFDIRFHEIYHDNNPTAKKIRSILVKEVFESNHEGVSKKEITFEKRTGKIFIAEIVSKLFIDPHGELNATIIIRDITERKASEEELSKLARIASKTSNIVILTDLDQHITWVNDGFERITGYSRNEVMGKKPNFLQGKDTSQKAVQEIREALAHNTTIKTEILNYTKSGSPYWLDIEIMPVVNKSGEVTGYMAIESDITDLKTLVQELQRSEQVLQTFMDYAPMVAFIKDKDGRYSFFNKAYRDFMDEKELKGGCTDYDLFDQEFAKECRKKDKFVLATEQTITFEHVVGDQTFLEYKFPLRDSNNEIFAIGGISLNLTEKIRTQKVIEEKEQRLRSLTDNLIDGVVYQLLANEKGEIESFPYVSSGALDLYEISADEIMQNFMLGFALVHAEDLGEMMKRAELSRQDLTPFDFEYRIITPSKKLKWVHTRAKPRRLETGKTIWEGLSVNVTKRKNLELAIQANEAKLQSIFNSLISGIIVVDIHGEITYANDSAFSILELGDETDEKNIIHNHEKLPISVVLSTGKLISNIEHALINKDGKITWLLVNAAPLFTTEQQLIGAVASFIDVTEEKQAKLELQKVHDELNAILNASTDATYFLDQHYNIRIFNKTGEETIKKIYGKQVKKGDSMLDYAAKGTEDDFKNNFNRALNGSIVTIEREIVYNPQIRIWTQVRYLPVFDKANNILGVCFNATDITQRKIAEQELFQSKRYFESLVNSQSSFLVRLSANGHYTFANRKYLEKLKITDERLGDKNIFTRILPEDQEFCSKVIQECYENPGKVLPVTLRTISTDGNLFYIEWEFVALQNEYGQIICIQAVGLDATERIISQTKLQKTSQRLLMATKAAQMGVWEWDISTGEIIWDKKMYEIHNVPPGTPMTFDKFQQMFEVENEKQKFENQQQIRNSIGNNTNNVLKLTLKANGNVKYIKIFSTTEEDQNNQPKRVTGVVYDVTNEEIANQRLLKTLYEKDLLIKEIHHRIKNNLQLVSSILYIKLAEIENVDIKVFLQEMRQKIKSIALIHEHLLQTESVNEIDIQHYLGKLIKEVQLTNLRDDVYIEFEVDIKSYVINLDTAIYCGLILNELLTNALKHAFTGREKGKVIFTFNKTENGFEMMMCDDGISLPEDVAPGKSQSFGMRLLEIFLKQINAEFYIERKQGTKYTISFKN